MQAHEVSRMAAIGGEIDMDADIADTVPDTPPEAGLQAPVIYTVPSAHSSDECGSSSMHLRP